MWAIFGGGAHSDSPLRCCAVQRRSAATGVSLYPVAAARPSLRLCWSFPPPPCAEQRSLHQLTSQQSGLEWSDRSERRAQCPSTVNKHKLRRKNTAENPALRYLTRRVLAFRIRRRKKWRGIALRRTVLPIRQTVSRSAPRACTTCLAPGPQQKARVSHQKHAPRHATRANADDRGTPWCFFAMIVLINQTYDVFSAKYFYLITLEHDELLWIPVLCARIKIKRCMEDIACAYTCVCVCGQNAGVQCKKLVSSWHLDINKRWPIDIWIKNVTLQAHGAWAMWVLSKLFVWMWYVMGRDPNKKAQNTKCAV